MSLRQNVQLKLDRHFLSGMFVGLRDFPPPYCVEPPTPFDTNLPSINEADLHQLRSQCPELREILKVYSTRIFDLMRIERPKVSESEMNTICRQASFISDTPPRLILAAERGVTGSHWWSGDENLSTTIPGSLKKSQLISSPGEGQFSWDRTDNFTPAKVVIAAGPASASEVSSSRFIGSLSNAPKSFENPMGHSRQLSERSSRFGTPEEDIPPVSEAPKFPRKGSEENISGLVHVDMPLLESPPEIISKSQIFESDGQLQGDSSSQQRNARASHPRAISAPKPITAHSRAAVKETTVDPISPTQTDIVSDLGGILLDGSSSDSKENSQITLTTAKKQRSDELIESLEKQICELQSQLSLKEQIAEESQNTEVNLRKDVFEFAKTIQKFMIEFRAEMAESKDGMAALIFESEKSTGGAVTCLQEWAEKLEQKLKSDFETATGAILELKQVEFSEQLSHLNEEIL